MYSFPPWLMTCLAAAVGVPLPQDAAKNQPSPCGNLMMREQTYLLVVLSNEHGCPGRVAYPVTNKHANGQGRLERQVACWDGGFPLP